MLVFKAFTISEGRFSSDLQRITGRKIQSNPKKRVKRTMKTSTRKQCSMGRGHDFS